MSERFERHRQPWRPEEIHKLHLLAKKGMAFKAIAKALTQSEESVKGSREARPDLDREASTGWGAGEVARIGNARVRLRGPACPRS